MLLWISFAIVTAAVIAAILRPMLDKRGDGVSAVAADLEVYKDQLSEIEADRDRGLIGENEAEAARNEVARRLLAKEADFGLASTAASSSASIALAKRTLLSGSLLIPLLSVGLYAVYGSPGLPARPHMARSTSPIEQSSVSELLARVEARLRENPDDGNGWEVIGPVYLRMERYTEAADAFANALRLKGESSARLGGFAEALVMGNGGIVSEDARGAFEKLARLEPDKPEPRFWLALAKEQDGKLAEAARDYRDLLEKAPTDAPWREAVAERLRELLARLGTPRDEIARIAGAPPSKASERGQSDPPSADAMAAAEKMSPHEREQFIKQMVDSLAARLKADGKDLQGWMRLVRAYKVLGNASEATTALGNARRNFAGDTAALSQLDALAKSLGLGS